ncbi:GAF domain-containing hybrid sensor histidine kinase/response regulator [Spirosoma rhododendri]|uniref:histidine kinase n=1 Tax=Spirosoma rhododendri TaxID=2728024 RepID=A0A7L5DQ59_9BACT|nr:GAF domain-containing hybrid sensor histidine kinase/response regulator [Spirosoma rhododendri]QJD78177.1 response regulator [Spirosoma rhododendri]
MSQIASQLCMTPFAMVSLIDQDRQWVKSSHGIDIDYIPRELSFCAHTINQYEPLVVENMKQDGRFSDHPSVIGPPNVTFYAGVPLRSSEGYAIGSLCVVDQKPRQLTAEQHTALKALADQVALLMELHRTNNSLRVARTEAEELAQQKASLLATLSHEIRTPLHALEGYTQLLLDQPTQPDQQSSLQRLQTTGRTLVSLVNNILDYSKLQAGKLLLEAIPFSVVGLIHQAVDMQAWQARQKNLQLTTKLDATIPHQLRGDATRLLQVLTNLISNALKFTKEGGVNVEASVIEQTDEQTTLFIEVVDTGIGIAPDSLATLFNEYTQVSAATTRQYGGTGLGLAITRQLIDLMDSHMEVTSEVGKGSRFGFRLTLPTVDETPPTVNWRTEGKLLAVDDSLFNTKMLGHIVRQQSGQLDTFNNPIEALEAARHTPYLSMLLDLHMPEMDGYDLARQLCDLQPGVPIIALSADDSAETLAKVYAAGFRGFLRKPFLPQQLVHLLDELTKPV